MACFHPLHLYRLKTGKLSGSKPAGEIPRPVTIACGHCSGCLLERSRQWAVRCVHEAKMHDHNSFITLTYDDEHLPANLSLDLDHWKLFAKALRQRLTRQYNSTCRKAGMTKPYPKYKPFRFYHCGEYGEGSGTRPINPHYHAILFGQDFSADRKFAKFTPQGHQTWTSAMLDETWGKGRCIIGSVTHQSASYVARYCMKKQTPQQKRSEPDTYQGRKREYATMSSNPGIGKPWLDKYKTDVYPHDYVVSQDGHKSRPPKYYDTQISEFELELIKSKRVENAKQHAHNNTPRRLADREKCLESKTSTLKLSRTL